MISFNIRDALESDQVLLFIRERLLRMDGDYVRRKKTIQKISWFQWFHFYAISILIFFWKSYAKLCSAVSSFLREYLGGRLDSLIFLAGHAELRILAGERERDTTRWQSCQRRPINLSSGCWHGDCRTELGWMARRAMRGHSRILHETVTEKLEAAAAPMAQEKGGMRERRGNVFEGKLYVGARK